MHDRQTTDGTHLIGLTCKAGHLVTRCNKLSYRRDSARCGCRSPQPKSVIQQSPANNLRPLNSHTHCLVIYLFISI